ncbi:uncharacterized protein LOC119348426 [Triticum dicoccoides]|uniref:uncharacterized protein LOC119348426 n=1 Tax=Triticum dicoccoides TaxID=85692 RepID=UPI00188E1F8F|nr:uncharacterized protein LOC119348426 [Triticum dicoccoides]
MLRPLRRLSGPLRRSLSTASWRPAWAMIYRISTAEFAAARGVSLALAPPPLASRVSVPRHAFGLDPLPDTASSDGQPSNFFDFGSLAPEQGSPQPASTLVDIFGSGVLAASSDGLLLLGTFRNRADPTGMFEYQGPSTAPFEVLDQAYARSYCCDIMRLARFVCNPVTGEMARLPDFDGTEDAFTASTGLLTQADGGHGPPRRYAAAQLSLVGDGRRFLLRRLSSETGEWDELLLPSPLPAGRLMYMNHEVLDFGGRLWWVDVSWGAVNVDPFSDRPELCLVELPGDIMLPDQQGEAEMRQLLQHRRMGVSDGRLRFVEVSKDEPFNIKSFMLDEQSGRWMLEHMVTWKTLCPGGKVAPMFAAIDPMSADLVHLTVPVGNGYFVSVDMRWKRPVECVDFGSGVHPSKCISSFVLPCVLPSFLGSSPIPDMHPRRLFSYATSFQRKQIPVIRQLLFSHEYEAKNEIWCPFEQMLVKGSMLKSLVPGGLIRVEDIIRNGHYSTGKLALLSLRDLVDLATVNLMRGVNVSELIVLENLLWAPSARGIMFKHTNLINNGEETGCPYLSIYELFKLAVLITTGKPIEEVNLPADLAHFLHYLQRATNIDKRLITNHSATRFPEERIQRNKSYNYLFRTEFKHFYATPAAARSYYVFEALGLIFPQELLTPAGLHPLIDYWASYNQEMIRQQSGNGVILTHQRPIVVPRFNTVYELGNRLIALCRDPFEHPYGPLYADPSYADLYPYLEMGYSIFQIEQLINHLIPLYGPTADEQILVHKLWDNVFTGQRPLPPHANWTDISGVRNQAR